MRRAAAALALLAGCGLQNPKVLVGTILQSPDLTALGLGPAAVTTAHVFFGDRTTSGSAPQGTFGADVTLSWTGSKPGSVVLPETAAGVHELTSTLIPYEPGATYTVHVAFNGAIYEASVVAPSRAAIAEVNATTHLFPAEPAATFTKQTVSRSGTDIAIYAVSQVQGASVGSPTCTNAPVNDAGALVQLLLAPGPFQAASFDLFRKDLTANAQQQCFLVAQGGPGAAPGSYVVTLTTVRKSDRDSGNLFTGSGILAGSADAGVLQLQ